jgi:hypothetical protein
MGERVGMEFCLQLEGDKTIRDMQIVVCVCSVLV